MGFISGKLFYRFIGVIYLIAFISLYVQYDGLLSENGLLPASNYINSILNHHYSQEDNKPMKAAVETGNIFYFANFIGFPVDCLAEIIFLIAMTCSLLITLGYTNFLHYLIVWICLIGFIGIGQTFLSFQWDILLSEVGFLCILTRFFFTEESISSRWCFRFLTWKLMFLAGVVKLQAQCPTWERLTALEYHFATQCIPNPISWYAHQLPVLLLRGSVAATILIEIPWTFLLLLPLTAVRRIGVIIQWLLQIMIIATGNYNFFNLLTCCLMIPCWLADDEPISPTAGQQRGILHFLSTPLVLPYKYLAKASQSKMGRLLSIGMSVVFMAATAVWMVQWQSLSYPDVKWYNIGDQLSLRMVWKDIEPYMTPCCLTALILCGVFHCLSTLTEIAHSPLGVISSLLSLWRLLGVVCLCCWLLLSASNLETVSSISSYLPSRVISFRQSYGFYHLTSSYGLFRRMTGIGEDAIDANGMRLSVVKRPELVLEGLSAERDQWVEIPFQYKPTSLDSPPPFIAPHQPRLDWQMWFAALGSYQGNPWLVHLIYKLLHPNVKRGHSYSLSNDTLSLLDRDSYPFHDTPPREIRVTLYDYDFTRVGDNSSVAHWWKRSNPREYLPPIAQDNPSVERFLQAHGLNPSQSYKSVKKRYSECLKMEDQFLRVLPFLPVDWLSGLHSIGCQVILSRPYRVAALLPHWPMRFFITVIAVTIVQYLMTQHRRK